MSEQTPLPPAVRGVATAPVTAYARPAAQGLTECQNKLKEAGIDKVVAEIQRQVDAWAQTNVAQQ